MNIEPHTLTTRRTPHAFSHSAKNRFIASRMTCEAFLNLPDSTSLFISAFKGAGSLKAI